MYIEVLNNVVGKYYDTDSLVHKMNSFIKILNTLIFVILTFFTYDLKINILIFIFAILFILSSNVPIKLYLGNIYKLKYFLLFIFLINFLIDKNAYVALILCFRIIIVIIYSMMLLYTTKQDELIKGLQILFKPLKVFKLPVNQIAHTIALSIYFIPTLIKQYEKVRKSQNNKGIYYNKLNIKNKIEVLSLTIDSMFKQAIKKADNISDSMEIRFFNYNQEIKSKFSIYYFDIFSILIHVALLILVIKESFI